MDGCNDAKATLELMGGQEITAKTVIYCHSCQSSFNCAGMDEDFVEFLVELHRSEDGHVMVKIRQDEHKECLSVKKLKSGQRRTASDSPGSRSSAISLLTLECT